MRAIAVITSLCLSACTLALNTAPDPRDRWDAEPQRVDGCTTGYGAVVADYAGGALLGVGAGVGLIYLMASGLGGGHYGDDAIGAAVVGGLLGSVVFLASANSNQVEACRAMRRAPAPALPAATPLGPTLEVATGAGLTASFNAEEDPSSVLTGVVAIDVRRLRVFDLGLALYVGGILDAAADCDPEFELEACGWERRMSGVLGVARLAVDTRGPYTLGWAMMLRAIATARGGVEVASFGGRYGTSEVWGELHGNQNSDADELPLVRIGIGWREEGYEAKVSGAIWLATAKGAFGVAADGHIRIVDAWGLGWQAELGYPGLLGLGIRLRYTTPL